MLLGLILAAITFLVMSTLSVLSIVVFAALAALVEDLLNAAIDRL